MIKRLALVAALLLPLCALAAPFKGEGFVITLPDGWETQQGVMNVPLMARPPQATDAEGWGQDLLTVIREPADHRRTCLDAAVLRKIQQFSYHAEAFEKLEEEPLEWRNAKGKGSTLATRLTLRYREGPRELMAYVLVLDAGDAFITATLTAPPARFERQRAPFRAVVESLRAR